jgi:hypothetical protein
MARIRFPLSIVTSFIFAATLLAPAAQAASLRDLAVASAGHGARISVSALNGRRMEEGETARFRIESNKTGFVHLYVRNASGRMQLWMENVPIRAGRKLQYPMDPSIKIRAIAPFGDDEIVAVLTRFQVDGFIGRRMTSSPTELDLDVREFEDELATILTADSKNPWVWARTVVTVRE